MFVCIFTYRQDSDDEQRFPYMLSVNKPVSLLACVADIIE